MEFGWDSGFLPPSGAGNVQLAVDPTREKRGPSWPRYRIYSPELSRGLCSDSTSLTEPTKWHGGAVPVMWHSARFALQERGASVWLWLHRQ